MLILLLALMVASVVKGFNQPEPDEILKEGIALYIENKRSQGVLDWSENDQHGQYRYALSTVELFNFYPDCCSFQTFDPEGPPISWLTSWKYDIVGVVVIKAGMIKVSGEGPKSLPALDSVVILNGDYEDVTSKIY